ncbi:MAG: hypothetical protein ITG02_11575 [Patulibacter sp.]|nr:hypothetical protein [Patulibacter sp.]
MATKQFSKRGAQARGISEDETPAVAGPCGPCRGTGKLLSSAATGPELGEPHTVTCPWCDGTGTSIPDRNAQEHPAETPPVLTEAQLEERKAVLAARAPKPRARKAAAKKPAAKKKPATKKPAAKKPAAE